MREDLSSPSPGEERACAGDQSLPKSFSVPLPKKVTVYLIFFYPKSQMNRRFLRELSCYIQLVLGNHEPMLSIMDTEDVNFSRNSSKPFPVLFLSLLWNFTRPSLSSLLLTLFCSPVIESLVPRMNTGQYGTSPCGTYNHTSSRHCYRPVTQ